MHSIDPSKITAELKKTDAETAKEVNNKVNSTSVNKERLAIGQLLKQTLPNLLQKGLLSVNTQKAMLSAKQILPASYTQVYIQDKVVQQQRIESDNKSTQTAITLKQLTYGTVRQWISGQIIQAVVYQKSENGSAKLLVNSSGQFDTKILSQVSLEGKEQSKVESLKSQVKAATEILNKVTDKLAQLPVTDKNPVANSTQAKTETPQARIKVTSEILNIVVAKLIQATLTNQSQAANPTQAKTEIPQAQIKVADKLAQLPVTNQSQVANPTQVKTETPQAQIKVATEILNKVLAKFIQAPVTDKNLVANPIQAKTETPQAQIKVATEILNKVFNNLSQPITQTLQQASKIEKIILANTPINNKIIQQSQLVQVKTDLPLQPGQQLLLHVDKKAGEVSFQIQHSPMESHKISQQINQHSLKQQALPQLLASLKEISTQINQSNTSFTAQFIKQVDKLIQQVPQLSDLSSVKEIKNVITNSGQFLENKLFISVIQSMNLSDSKSKPITNSSINQLSQADLKSNLAQLVAMIQKNEALVFPKSLLSDSALYKSIEQKTKFNPGTNFTQAFDLPNKVVHAQVQAPAPDSNLSQLTSLLILQNKILAQLDGVLSRIIATQLTTRESRTEQVQINIEIPFRNNDQQEVLQLKIREQKKQSEAEKGNKIWTANMAFHLPSLGGIRIYITLDKQDLAMQFWTEEKNTQQLFQQYFSLLTERLYKAGFNISQLSVFHGIPDAAQKEQKNSTFIVDERV